MENNYEKIESSQKQHSESIRHQGEMNIIVLKEEYTLFQLLKPKLYQDGNQWIVLYGENIGTGVYGCGETPYIAILNFNQAWHKTI